MDYSDESSGPKPSGLAGRIGGGFERVGRVRDGFLVTGSALYIVGYSVWSYNAWRNKLGLLPALDPQYFVAGLIPMLVLSAGYLVASRLKRFFVYWLKFVGEEAPRIGRILRFLLLRAFWGTLVLVLLGPIAGGAVLLMGYFTLILARWLAPDAYQLLRRFSFANAYDSLLELVLKLRSGLSHHPAGAATRADRWLALGFLFAGLFVFLELARHRDDLSLWVLGGRPDRAEKAIAFGLVVTVTFLPPMKDRYLAWVGRSYRAFWVYVAVPLLVLLALLFYLARVYPDLPQEFGGVKPRCASLDVARAQLSDDTLRDLVPDDQIIATQAVVRSLAVEVLFSGSSVVLVRSHGKVHEITRSAIQAITACD